MNRRTFVALMGGLGTLSVFGYNAQNGSESDEEPETTEDTPPEVKASQELAEDFHEVVMEHFESGRVFIDGNGDIVFEYVTGQETAEELESELYRIAELYVGVIEDGGHTPRTLSIVTGEVQAVVSEHGIKSYLDGDLNEDAFYQTIELTEAKRTEDDEQDHSH